MGRLLQSLDLVVLGLVSIVGVWVLASGRGSGRAPADAALERARAAREGLEARLSEDRYESTEGAAALQAVAAAPAEVARSWNAAPSAELPTGLLYHEPTLKDLREGRELELRFEAPRGLVVNAEAGEIRLAWELDPLSTVPPSGWIVYRRTDEEPRRRLVVTAPETRSHVDRDVVPGVLYTYEVVAVTDDPTLKARIGGESAPSRGVQARARRDFELEVVGWDDDSGRARIRVRKLSEGVWHDKIFDAVPDAEIGARDAGSGVDYRTGSRVIEARVGTETVEETREEVVFDRNGRVVFEGETPVTRTATHARERRVATVVLRNELGRQETLTAPLR